MHTIAHKVGDVASGIDNLLTQARNVPIVGQAAEALQNNALYKEAQDIVKTGVKTVDQVGDVGGSLGGAIDTAIQKYLPTNTSPRQGG